jgi:hypothetical protein
MRPMFAAPLLLLLLFPSFASAADEAPPLVTLKGHKFVPDRIEMPSGVKFKLTIKNEDDASAEFESFELKREKVVLPGQEITVFLGPLDPGTYPFFDDFHPETKGLLVIK